MTTADRAGHYRALANLRTHTALAEAEEQLSKGWHPIEVLVVLADAETVILDLLDTAAAADENDRERAA